MADPFVITSGTGTVADADGESYTVRVRLKCNPALFIDYPYTLTTPSAVIYVNANASGNNNGTSWADAFTSLQDALRATCTCGGGEIWVAQGTYYPDVAGNSNTNDRNSTFQLCNGVKIYGGFMGKEDYLSQRNVTTDVTILSGDLQQDDDQKPIVSNASTNTNTGDNAYNVVTGSGTDNTAVLDGFTVTAGNADGYDGNKTEAAGCTMIMAHQRLPIVFLRVMLHFLWVAQYTITLVRLHSPAVAFWAIGLVAMGAGMSNSGSNPILTNCNFSNNSALNSGAGWIML